MAVKGSRRDRTYKMPENLGSNSRKHHRQEQTSMRPKMYPELALFSHQENRTTTEDTKA